MTKPAKRLLNGQLPVPPVAGDVARDISFDGGQVRAVSVQGKRPYQEDRFLVERGFALPAAGAKAFLAAIFSAAAARTDANDAGSTATAVVITEDLQLKAAFVGDSPVVVFLRDPKTGAVLAHKLTRDHHARAPDEKARIEREGGMVALNGRVEGSLELSRAFGDAGYIGVSQTPEYATRDLKADLAAGKEVYICVSSDGLYPVLEPENYVRRVRDAISAGREAGLADIFTAYAYEHGSGDNITALTFKVPADLKENLFLAVADGHGGDETSQEVIDSFAAGVKALRNPPQKPPGPF